jgi:hypothetical protein
MEAIPSSMQLQRQVAAAVQLVGQLTVVALAVVVRIAAGLVQQAHLVKVMLVVPVVSEVVVAVAVLVPQVALHRVLTQEVMVAMALRQASQAHQ